MYIVEEEEKGKEEVSVLVGTWVFRYLHTLLIR